MKNQGAWAAFAAYFLWGVIPIYWKQLQHVPAIEILAHRLVWSFLLLFAVLLFRARWDWLRNALRQPRIIGSFLTSAALIGVNWLIYIWAVNSSHTVDASLGYFITPLINVALGIFILGERLRRWQMVSFLFAGIGVTYLIVSNGVILWIAVALAVTFSLYGFLRKTAALGAFEGLSLEMGILVMPAFIYLLFLNQTDSGLFLQLDLKTDILLLLTSLITVIPLISFAYGAQRVAMITLGLLQYAAPTLQFLVGVTLYEEPLSVSRLTGFVIIWIALAIYSIDGIWEGKRRSRRAVAGKAAI